MPLLWSDHRITENVTGLIGQSPALVRPFPDGTVFRPASPDAVPPPGMMKPEREQGTAYLSDKRVDGEGSPRHSPSPGFPGSPITAGHRIRNRAPFL